MSSSKILVLSLPRSGSSFITQVIADSGYQPSLFAKPEAKFSAHEFNKHGYYEDVPFTLLNDQLLKLYFGMEYSFLYPPSHQDFQKIHKSAITNLPEDFHYDVDEKTVFIPKNFTENVEDFTGTDWDVWGITRMVNGGKWQNCYIKNQMATKNDILTRKEDYKRRIEQTDYDLVLKDPRLALTLPLYNLENVKIVWIKRKPQDTLASMRRHYGPRMFTDELMPNTPYVSNHFNHKVQPMSFEEYLDRYEKAIEYSLSKYPHCIVYFDDLAAQKNLQELEEFIGKPIQYKTA